MHHPIKLQLSKVNLLNYPLSTHDNLSFIVHLAPTFQDFQLRKSFFSKFFNLKFSSTSFPLLLHLLPSLPSSPKLNTKPSMFFNFFLLFSESCLLQAILRIQTCPMEMMKNLSLETLLFLLLQVHPTTITLLLHTSSTTLEKIIPSFQVLLLRTSLRTHC